MKSAAVTLFSASLIASAAAHGWVGTLTVNGKKYIGNKPVEQTPHGVPSVVRQISNNLPVKDVTSPALICGRSALPAADVATVPAGATMLFDWNTLSGVWFHNVGPIITYLASCGTESCAEFDATKAKWFKIDQQGQDENGNWAQAKLDNGSPASVTLPANIAPGSYLVRTEIIALHTAQSPGGAEFYPSCSQITVTGSGSGVPAASELVSFPGAYNAKAPGILLDVYDMKTPYQFPGPPVAAFVSGAPPPPAQAPAPARTTPAHTPTSTGTAAKPTGTKVCKNKNGKKSGNGNMGKRERIWARADVPGAEPTASPVAAPAVSRVARVADTRRSRARHGRRVAARSH
ncbi:glycoside hydrolase family 61 protein [Mycena metata]|uniref:lytic cellulose monooxygenase (C4-dehydrogenating) n=1 Tax=Mycena metata TaxID=1033252 RepID=A0AAD7JFH4_9AGAR|nr:glycoside hydrolase family 61 protein [Mycena metata]